MSSQAANLPEPEPKPERSRSHDRLVSLIARQRSYYDRVRAARGGVPLAELDPEARVAEVRNMVLACEDELHEALNEVGWKPWATSRHVNEAALFGELRDAWQFLTNLMCLAYPGDTAAELADRLEHGLGEKWVVNLRRVDRGYDGVTSKCPRCRRDYEDAGTTCRPATVVPRAVTYDGAERLVDVQPFCGEVGHFV